MMAQSGKWGHTSLIATFGGFVRDGERTASYKRNGDNGSYYGSVHCKLPYGLCSVSKYTTRVQLRRRSRFSVMLYERGHRSTPRVIAAFAGLAHQHESATDHNENHDNYGQKAKTIKRQ
jgi:hypothetical protein